MSLGDSQSAIQKLLLANLPEFAYALAKEFQPGALDQVLVMLFNKTVFYKQMSLTNALINQIRNPRLKEVMEISLYMNAPDDNMGEIRSNSNGAAGQANDSTVFDLIVSQRLEDAVNAVIQNYRSC